jgi:hypothetical protein
MVATSSLAETPQAQIQPIIGVSVQAYDDAPLSIPKDSLMLLLAAKLTVKRYWPHTVHLTPALAFFTALLFSSIFWSATGVAELTDQAFSFYKRKSMTPPYFRSISTKLNKCTVAEYLAEQISVKLIERQNGVIKETRLRLTQKIRGDFELSGHLTFVEEFSSWLGKGQLKSCPDDLSCYVLIGTCKRDDLLQVAVGAVGETDISGVFAYETMD